MQKTNEIKHYMLVPLNQHALEFDMDKELNPDSGNFKEWALTDAEMNSIINSLLFDYCEKFDVYIDVCEDRVLDKEFIAEALCMAKEFQQHCKKEVQKVAVQKVIATLEFANSTNMPVWFWF